MGSACSSSLISITFALQTGLQRPKRSIFTPCNVHTYTKCSAQFWHIVGAWGISVSPSLPFCPSPPSFSLPLFWIQLISIHCPEGGHSADVHSVTLPTPPDLQDGYQTGHSQRCFIIKGLSFHSSSGIIPQYSVLVSQANKIMKLLASIIAIIILLLSLLLLSKISKVFSSTMSPLEE